jgi:uncharacterized protein involved in exopolysaccharide biosynthesis
MRTGRTGLLGVILIFIGIALAGAGLFMLIQPNEFQAAAIISVDHEESGVSYDPYFIQTEFEVIQSEIVLSNVIADLNLNEVWGKKYNGGQPLKYSETTAIIQRSLNFNVGRNNKLIEIQVFRDNPTDAAKLANAIAEQYRKFRVRQFQQVRQSGIEFLEGQFHDSESKIAIAQEQVEKLRASLNISDATVNSNDAAAAPYFAARRQLDDLQKFHEILKTKLPQATNTSQQTLDTLVEIVSPAILPSRPIRPNRPLATVLVLGGLSLVVGGRMLLRTPKK